MRMTNSGNGGVRIDENDRGLSFREWRRRNLGRRLPCERFDFHEQGGRREGSCERFRATANKENEEKVRA
uniref:Uncharacterized protein n=2 Tax=Cucumis melo TaxID=3656 RepID=A0A9I9E0I5_CUCME